MHASFKTHSQHKFIHNFLKLYMDETHGQQSGYCKSLD